MESRISSEGVERMTLERVAEILSEESSKELGGEQMPIGMSREEVHQIATATADEVMNRIREQEHDTLMLHSVPHCYGSPGIVVNEAMAMASPCRCLEYRPGRTLCFSRGVIGALSDEQKKIYCPTIEVLESPGLEKRLKGWMGAVETCKAEIVLIPKGERLEPWLGCMGRELVAKGIEA
jgi:hypothetical protein